MKPGAGCVIRSCQRVYLWSCSSRLKGRVIYPEQEQRNEFGGFMTRTLLMLYLAVLLFSVTAFADSNAVFTNQLGTLFSKKSGTSNYFLQMGTPGTNTGSALNQITGAAGLNCGGLLPACSGNVAW